MCGLLAISACHLAVLADDTTIEEVHRERSAQFFSSFSSEWEEATMRDLGVMVAGVEEEEKKVGAQMRCLLDCAHWALAEPRLDHGIILEPAASTQLRSILTAIRGFVILSLVPSPHGVQCNVDDQQERTFIQARTTLGRTSSSDAESFRAFSSSDTMPSALFKRLDALPSRIAETFGKPESVRDVFATLSAIAALVECCDTSFGSDEVGQAWRAMATWLIKVSDHFNQMVWRHSPAALVVLAHWAASLVTRAEHCGCWFLRGSGKLILTLIAENLPTDDRAIQSLVGGLMS